MVPSRQFRPKGRLFNDKGPVVPRGIPVELVVLIKKTELPGGYVRDGEDVLAEGQKNVGIAEAELQPFAGTAHLGLGRLPVEEGGDKVKGSPPHLSFAVGEIGGYGPDDSSADILSLRHNGNALRDGQRGIRSDLRLHVETHYALLGRKWGRPPQEYPGNTYGKQQ